MKDIGAFSIDNRGGLTKFTRGRGPFSETSESEMASMDLNIGYMEFVSGLQKWFHGSYIQDVFPNLNADEREFIMTGLTPEAWTEIFGKEDNNDNELSEEPGR